MNDKDERFEKDFNVLHAFFTFAAGAGKISEVFFRLGLNPLHIGDSVYIGILN